MSFIQTDDESVVKKGKKKAVAPKKWLAKTRAPVKRKKPYVPPKPKKITKKQQAIDEAKRLNELSSFENVWSQENSNIQVPIPPGTADENEGARLYLSE